MTFSKGLRLRLEFAALWLAIVLARAMPVQTASWLSGNIWRLIAPRLGRQKRALANLELAYPEKSPADRKAIAAAMWENLGRTFAESLHIQALTKSDRIVFEPAQGFDEASARRKALHRVWPSLGKLGDSGAWRPAARRFPHRCLSAHVQPARRSPAARHARAALQGGSDAQNAQ